MTLRIDWVEGRMRLNGELRSEHINQLKAKINTRRVRYQRRADQMNATAELADRLTKLLMLAHPPVAVSFRKGTPCADAEAVVKQPAGWAPAGLAYRYPLRARVENPHPDLFRVGEPAVVLIRGR